MIETYKHFLPLLKTLLPKDEDDAAVLLLQLTGASPAQRLPLITGNAFSLKGLGLLDGLRDHLIDLAAQVAARWVESLKLPEEKRPSALEIISSEIEATLGGLEEPAPAPKAQGKTKAAAKTTAKTKADAEGG